MRVELATLDDIPRLNELYSRCSESMKRKYGLNHWDSVYPQDLLAKRINEGQVYLVHKRDKFVASFMLVKEYPQPYIDALAVDSRPFTYLNRLAVFPELQGQGIGKWCMGQLESLAAKSGSEVLRFDILADYPQLRDFYTKLGYVQIGEGRTRRFSVQFYEKPL